MKPKFKEIARFREEFGLEVWDPVSGELELNDRIFDLINAWVAEDPVARASWERWGVPLRTQDVAELEYREHYIETDGPLIRQWAEATYPDSYAGYYVDHRAGGIVRVGFTQNESTAVEELKALPGMLGLDRIAPFPTQPAHSYSELASLQASIISNEGSHPPLRGLITRASVDTEHNLVKVGATNVAQVSTQLAADYGPGAPFSVYFDSQQGHFTSATTRYTDEGQLRSGQAIGWYNPTTNRRRRCTAGLPAAEGIGKSQNGQPQTIHFMITAGHCFVNGHVVSRFHGDNDKAPKAFGIVRRRANDHEQDGYFTDAEAIEVDLDPKMIARDIVGNGKGTISIDGVAVAEEGMMVCISGFKTDHVNCSAITGEVEAFPAIEEEEGVYEGPFYVFRTNLDSEEGDSGAPIWIQGSRKAVGVNSIGGSGVAWFTPLLPPHLPEKGLTPYDVPKRDKVPGLLNAPGMGDMHVMTAP